MPSTTLRNKSDDDRMPAAVYWRRRFMALLLGIAILGVVAWAASGALGEGSTSSDAADVGRLAHKHAHPASTPGASSPAPDVSGPGGMPAVSRRAAPPAASGPGAAPAASPPAASTAGGPLSCSPGDVVISLFGPQASSGQSQPAQSQPAEPQPAEFDIDVVSTAAGTCSFNVGPRYVGLVITAGSRRVWDSADCAAGPGSLMTSLTRGVPVILPVTWDLQTSAPGCPATAGPAGDGSFTATAAAGSITSNPVTFRPG
jgi:hypothetical protein